MIPLITHRPSTALGGNVRLIVTVPSSFPLVAPSPFIVTGTTNATTSSSLEWCSIRGYATAAPQTNTSQMDRLRRLRDKKKLGTPQDLTSRFIKLPDERVGNELRLNWKLVNYAVAPSGEAFHNLNLRHLLMLAQGKTDPQKALVVPKTPVITPQVFFNSTGPVSPSLHPSFQPLDFSLWQRLFAGITRQLSDAPNVFLTDGSAGSHPLAGGNIRIISSDPNSSLYLKHLLSRTSPDFDKFKHDILIYHSPEFSINDPQFKGDSFAVYQLFGGEHTLNTVPVHHTIYPLSVDDKAKMASQEAAVLFLFGKINSAALKSALLSFLDFVQLKAGHLPLNASLLTDQKDNSAIVFDPTGALLDGRVHPQLFASENIVYSDKAIYRTFDGVTHKSTKLPTARGDYIDTIEGTHHITQPLSRYSAASTALYHPSKPKNVVFIVNDKSGVLSTLGRLQASSALYFWKAGFDGENNIPFYAKHLFMEPTNGLLAERFKKYLQENNPSVFVINTSGLEGQLNTTDLDNILTAVLNGSASQAVVSPVKGLEIGAISKLPNVQPSVLKPYRGWKDKEAHFAATARQNKRMFSS